jgi:predicted lipid-binding transport protein (Tim44 family)
MNRALGLVGAASTLGRSLQWTAQGLDRRRVSTRTVQITVTPRNGRTTIRIEEPLGALAGGLFAGLMGGLGGGSIGPAAGIGIGAFHSGSVTVALIGGVVSASYLLARTIFGRAVRKRGDSLQDLMSRLVEHASATAVVTAPIKPPTLERPAERESLGRGE